jgi:hypothetical protein
MRVLEQTSTKLTVQHKHSDIWLVIGYFILHGSGFIALEIVLNSRVNVSKVKLDFFVLIGLLCFTMALLLLASNILVVTSTFDKNISKITVQEQKLFNTNVREHSLSEISDVRIESSYGLKYKLISVLKSGKRLTLSFPTLERSLEEPIAQIRSFLGYY